ncbi:hypothetical protein Pfo_000385 [Paulownia fortunei]|nr:hypothetical protein Pfo_000385 [Paulownia fortunei]
MLSPTPIDELFDLDMALTLPENSRVEMNNHQLDAQPTAAAADQMVENMPTMVAGGGGCTICMEGFPKGGGWKQVPCGHVFHSNCIAGWLSLHNSCPLCRFKVTDTAAATTTTTTSTAKLFL